MMNKILGSTFYCSDYPAGNLPCGLVCVNPLQNCQLTWIKPSLGGPFKTHTTPPPTFTHTLPFHSPSCIVQYLVITTALGAALTLFTVSRLSLCVDTGELHLLRFDTR
jgi:hypothetical protein